MTRDFQATDTFIRRQLSPDRWQDEFRAKRAEDAERDRKLSERVPRAYPTHSVPAKRTKLAKFHFPD